MRNRLQANGKYSSVYYSLHVFIFSFFPASFIRLSSSFVSHRNARLHFYIHIKGDLFPPSYFAFNHFKLLQWAQWFKQLLFNSMSQPYIWWSYSHLHEAKVPKKYNNICVDIYAYVYRYILIYTYTHTDNWTIDAPLYWGLQHTSIYKICAG